MNLIHNLQDKVDDLVEIVLDDSELILDNFSIDEFLKNPREYLQRVSDEFLDQHIDEIQLGANAGAKYAEDVLEKS